MMIVLIALMAFVFMVEVVTTVVIGGVRNYIPKEYLAAELATGTVDHSGNKIIYTKNGFFAVCGVSLFGAWYYCRNNQKVRLPWWSSTCKAVKKQHTALLTSSPKTSWRTAK